MTLNLTLIRRSSFSVMDLHVIRAHCLRFLVLALIISTSTGSSESVPTSSAEKDHGRHDTQSHSIIKRDSNDVFDKRFFIDEGRKRTRNQLYNLFNSVGIRSPSKHIHRFVGKRTAERNEVPVHVLSPAFAMGPIFGDEFARYVRRIPRLSLAFVGKRRIKPFNFYPKRLTSKLISREFPAFEHKFIGKRSFLRDDDNTLLDDNASDDRFDNFNWSDIESKTPKESEFSRMEESAEPAVDDDSMFNRYISNFLNVKSSSHLISKRDVSSIDRDFSSFDSNTADNSDLEFLKNFISILNKDATDADKSYDILKTDEENMDQELENSDDKRIPHFHSYVGKRLPHFHAYVGKRLPAFHTYVGKRFSRFHSYVGKRIPRFHSYIGKRAPDFHYFVGKRSPRFHSYIGKRASDTVAEKRIPKFHTLIDKMAPEIQSSTEKEDPKFQSSDDKRSPRFHSYVGKRIPAFHTYVGKRVPDSQGFVDKRIPRFHTYVGKRAPAFHTYVGKRLPAFHTYVGKRLPAFHTYVGKRLPAFHTYVGKRAPAFHTYVGKRLPAFHTYVGKRFPRFHSYVGKREPDSQSFDGKQDPDFHASDDKRIPRFRTFVGKQLPAFHSYVGKRDPESPDSLQEEMGPESDFASVGGFGNSDVDTIDRGDQINNGNRFINLLDHKNAYFASDFDSAAEAASNPLRAVNGNSLSAGSKSPNGNLAKNILRDTILNQGHAATASESLTPNSSSSDGIAAKT